MLSNSNKLPSKVEVLTGHSSFFDDVLSQPIAPFSDQVLEFFDQLSKKIMSDSLSRPYPDLVTLGFWLRKSSMMKLKESYSELQHRRGRGITFHIAPSKVPLNFAYSFVASLLAGNHSIVRISSKYFEQAERLVEIINEILPASLRDYLILVKYLRDKDVNDYFSLFCDVRVVWGGDQTIKDLRQSQLKVRAKEIVFADRISLLLINSDSYMIHEDKKSLARGFYNDTYLFDQNACTSPRLVIWTGNQIEKAKETFWTELLTIVLKEYENYPVRAIDKLKLAYLIAAHFEGTTIKSMTNWLHLVDIVVIDTKILDYVGNSGLFIEYSVKQSLIELRPLLGDKIQTVSYFGYEPKSLRDELINIHPQGIDRLSTIGQTMDFNLHWDGYDLINEMTKEICLS